MKIAVTGTSGRIGRAIHFALSRDHEVVGIDRALSSATTVLGEIADLSLLTRAFKNADAVVHTAALHAPHVGLFDESEFARINIDGTRNVVRAAKANGVRTLVFTSTTALYGHAVNDNPKVAAWINEQTPPKPKSIYHRTKLEAEQYLAAQATEYFRITTLRMSRCFPEPAPIMATYRLHRGIDARDVAEGHRLAILKPGDPYRRFILSGKSPFRRSDCAALRSSPRLVLEKRCPELCALFDQRGWQLPRTIDRVYDSSAAQDVLGWQPRHDYSAVVKQLDEDVCEVLPPRTEINQFSE